ncbi:caspase family protein, partial [Neobacillus drentensis]|uniref:caspase family protein n=1 Tax=Neobacillus drentensis TaxID=220684 RepID=UPI002FFE691B
MIKNALIIGNADYEAMRKLKNPVNDVEDIGCILRKFNFEVIQAQNVKIEEMDRLVSEYKDILKDADIGLFYFAGHGFQIEGKNYLATIDTSSSDEYSLKRTSFCLNDILDMFEASNARTKIIILDACRNNPFGGRFRGDASMTLAPINAPKGTIIGYSTSPGETADDGEGRNGVYTQALLTHIETIDISIEEMFKRVRNTLSLITMGKQTSWEHTSLIGDFYFNYGYISGEFSTRYSKNAFADSRYVFEDNSLDNVIKGLKSHDWYTQNPAITSLKKLQLNEYKVDSLFVLGRNIYQAACGNSNEAIDFIKNLENELNKEDEEVAFHLLNGLLYEVYFDSRGKIRRRLKTDHFEKLLSLIEKPKYEESKRFIRYSLIPFENKVLYKPGHKELVFDIFFKEDKDNGKKFLSQICYNA